MYAQKLSFDYAHTLHTVRIVHNAHSVHRSRVQKRQSCDCINFVRATDPSKGSGVNKTSSVNICSCLLRPNVLSRFDSQISFIEIAA